jgi:toxin YoeB
VRVLFTKTARRELDSWIKTDASVARKIMSLVSDIAENGPAKGTGKPERLRYRSNPPQWSRRINGSDRLVYSIDGDAILVISCKGHYED